MAGSSKKQIVLVDDHTIVRNGLKELIEKLGDYQVSEQFDSGSAFLDSCSAPPARDLLILDISMPGMTGDMVLETMNSRQIRIPTLVLTLNDDEAMAIRLFRLGARGYLLKNCTADMLKSALQSVFSHGYYHNEFLTLSLQAHNPAPKQSERELILEQLTTREKEFLKLVCHEQEYTYKEIAHRMNVTPRTVDGYREAVFGKLNIRSKPGLVLFALKHQLANAL